MAEDLDLLEEKGEGAPDDSSDFEDYESYSLTTRQKIWTGVAILLSFLTFSFFFLPYELLVRAGISKFGGGQMQLDFDRIQLGLLGKDELSNVRLGMGTLTVAAEEVSSSLSKRHLMAGNAIGQLELLKLDLDLASFEASTGTFDADLALTGFNGPARAMNGTVEIKTGPLRLKKLPDNIPIPASPEDIKISRVQISLNMQNGRVNFNGTKIDSNLFNITLAGTGVAQNSLADMSLDGRICLRPAGNLEEQNKIIFDFYVMAGGAAGGQLCFAVKGNLDRPDFQKQDS